MFFAISSQSENKYLRNCFGAKPERNKHLYKKILNKKNFSYMHKNLFYSHNCRYGYNIK